MGDRSIAMAPLASARASMRDFLFSPGKFFRSLNTRPDWIPGFLITIALGMVTAALSLPLLNSIETNSQGATHDGGLRTLIVIPAALGIAIGLTAGVLWLVAWRFEKRVGLTRILAIVSYAYIVVALDRLIGFSMNYLGRWRDFDKTLQIRRTCLSLGTIVDLTHHPILLAVSNTCGLFSFWYWGLLVVGLTAVGLTKKQALVVVGCLALASVLLVAAMTPNH